MRFQLWAGMCLRPLWWTTTTIFILSLPLMGFVPKHNDNNNDIVVTVTQCKHLYLLPWIPFVTAKDVVVSVVQCERDVTAVTNVRTTTFRNLFPSPFSILNEQTSTLTTKDPLWTCKLLSHLMTYWWFCEWIIVQKINSKSQGKILALESVSARFEIAEHFNQGTLMGSFWENAILFQEPCVWCLFTNNKYETNPKEAN